MHRRGQSVRVSAWSWLSRSWSSGSPRVSASASASGTLAITGPDRLAVGEQATFTASTEGVETWVWELPDGQFITDEATVSMTATSAGAAEIVLRSRTAEGTELETRHPLRVDG